MLLFKTTRLGLRQGDGRPSNGKPVGTLKKSYAPLSALIFTKDLRNISPVGGTLGVILIPFLIVLFSVVAGFAVAMHMSGQPGYSARVNMSPPTMSE
ncbi:hypothetical protein GGD50_003386 [Rhizobium paranaense]|uniref:Uncharacterized protein n=1 Tax=Rhizobium paranaense TaxID=1650438 RepID=A0A7W9D1X4_9HYPH|nr:hypothetical protein [Rhizobium paranaense]